MKKRHLCKLSDLLELQKKQKLREKKLRDHISHQHQVEHALLDMTGVLPSTAADEDLEQKNASVSSGFYYLHVLAVIIDVLMFVSGLDRYGYRVSADTRQYCWVSVSANTYLSIGANTSSLVLSQRSTLLQRTIVSSLYHIFVHTYIYNLHTPIPRTKSHFRYKKFVQPGIGVGIAAADSIGYRAPSQYRSRTLVLRF